MIFDWILNAGFSVVTLVKGPVMLDVIPISMTAINWDVLLVTLKRHLGRSLTKSLDDKHMKVGDLSSFLVILAEMQDEGVDPNKILIDATYFLRHISSGFLITTSVFMFPELAFRTNLKITCAKIYNQGEYTAIVTGSLEDWRSAIINCNDNDLLRPLFNKCLLNFEKIGLGQLWHYYQKIDVGDSTFKLIEKK